MIGELAFPDTSLKWIITNVIQKIGRFSNLDLKINRKFEHIILKQFSGHPKIILKLTVKQLNQSIQKIKGHLWRTLFLPNGFSTKSRAEAKKPLDCLGLFTTHSDDAQCSLRCS